MAQKKFDEIAKSQFAAWIPASAGMTVIVYD
jgi:hypothetical protein